MIEIIIQHVTEFIGAGGYLAVFILMFLESTALPVPSESVMPFVGFLVNQKTFSLAGAIIFSTIGTICGSLLSYAVGRYGGQPFLEKYGRYFLIRSEELVKTEKFFQKHGEKTIFISRFIPVIRHLISLPAGLSKMNLPKFSIYTILGGVIWNTFLAGLGFYLKQNWLIIENYTKFLDITVLVIIIGLIIIFIIKRKKYVYS
ncbi:MAG: hypothetical protein COU83_02135 [Candidatus Portnoybacteria bacterium CG10_big_fil_rev_8_21_14_0_10_40_22]|uniref:VTT domain-containing protein n=1 Tax=Candidatus Portnoybacteria bacterium CG10_big_fil_rev_8_21_14_0_10_40_22 TaxID=1974814 RepID=A0A2M8KFQ4_9BACT|nr:MAG: hypothetical protein COU83_02135 [Candidatus Portnoybacteria bacterium CG10_big_fil_rev_8_21_14_0_10_40_22]